MALDSYSVFTFDVQVDGVADTVALGVMRGAGVDPRVGPRDFLED